MKLIIREISDPSEVTERFVTTFRQLVPQLSKRAKPPTAEEITEIVRSPATTLFVAQEDKIIGSLTLVLFRIPTGLHARIEDVVVDESARGAGIGRALNIAAMERAAAEGAQSIDLTSSPTRQAANELYLSLGFKQRDTNVYRCEL